MTVSIPAPTTTTSTTTAPATSLSAREIRLYDIRNDCCQAGWPPLPLLLLFERFLAILALAFIFDHECVCLMYGWVSPRNFWNFVRWLAPIIPATVTAITTILLHLLSVLEYDKRVAYS
jgi:hypothetical protein